MDIEMAILRASGAAAYLDTEDIYELLVEDYGRDIAFLAAVAGEILAKDREVSGGE